MHIEQMFQALARDRLERLNVSPSATPWTYFRVYCALLLVFSVDLLWYFLLLLIISFILSIYLSFCIRRVSITVLQEFLLTIKEHEMFYSDIYFLI